MSDKRRRFSLEEALAQNAEYFGFDICDEIELNGEIFEIRYRELLDAETRERLNKVYQMYAECDREEIQISDGKGGYTTIVGAYKEPRTYKGELFDLDEHIGRAVWGDEKYQRWIDAGGPPGMIQIVWNRMRHQFTTRLNADPKSR